MFEIISILKSITLTDFLDVFVVWFLLYKFLVIAKGTRAIQILFGIGLLALLYWLSLVYDLYSLNWILEQFFQYFFVIIVILFQDSVKNALANLGKIEFLEKNERVGKDLLLEELIIAIDKMSSKKVGTLLAFQKTNGLANFINTGTILNSRFNADLLYAIFHPKSPLHDGAAIIVDGQLTSVGCFLPLSSNAEQLKNLGTRHRAALGLSEISDAVVIVVSEETGQKSIFYRSQMYRVKNQEFMRNKLREFLADERETKFEEQAS